MSEACIKACQRVRCDSGTASGCDSPAKRLRCSHDASVAPVDSMNSNGILCIPDEVIHIIIAELPAAADVHALTSTCRGLNRSINGDPQLPDYGCLAAAAWLWRWRREDCLLLAARCRCRSETEAFIIELLKRLMKRERAEAAVTAAEAAAAVAAAGSAAVPGPVVAAVPEPVVVAAAAPDGMYEEEAEDGGSEDSWSEDEEDGGSEDEGQAADLPEAAGGRDTVLHVAADRGHAKLLAFLLAPLHDDGGGYQELINAADVSGSTPLILACINGHVEAARQLLDHPGNKINATDGDGKVNSELSVIACAHCLQVDRSIIPLLQSFIPLHFNVWMLTSAPPMQTALFWAALGSHVAPMALLLNQPEADASIVDAHGRTCLFYASSPAIISQLMSRPELHPNKLDHNGNAALHAFAAAGKLTAVETLVAHADATGSTGRIDVNVKDRKERTALMAAALGGRYDVVIRLLRHPGIRTAGVLQLACRGWAMQRRMAAGAGSVSGCMQVLRKLLKHPGMDVNGTDGSGQAALHLAVCFRGGRPLVRELMSCAGISANARDSNNRTPLHLACEHADSFYAVQALVKCPGIAINAQDRFGQTPLHIACKMDNMKAILELLRHTDVDISVKDAFGQNVVHVAAGTASPPYDGAPLPAVPSFGRGDGAAAAQRLPALSQPSPVMPVKQCGGNPFVLGALRDLPAVLQSANSAARPTPPISSHHGSLSLLLRHPGMSAEIADCVDNERRTPLHEACRRGPPGAADELILHSPAISLNSSDLAGRTLLMAAAEGGQVGFVRCLLKDMRGLQADAWIAAIDMHGNTCLHIACRHDKADALEALLQGNVDARSQLRMKNDSGRTPMAEAQVYQSKQCCLFFQRELNTWSMKRGGTAPYKRGDVELPEQREEREDRERRARLAMLSHHQEYDGDAPAPWQEERDDGCRVPFWDRQY